jgi:hypothetical protein
VLQARWIGVVLVFLPGLRVIMARMAYPLREACNVGHEFTPANTRTAASGARICIACHRRINREAIQRRRCAQRVAQGPAKDPAPRKPPAKPPPKTPAAAVMCDPGFRGTMASRVTDFDTVADAATFAAQTPCDNPACIRVHILVWRHGDRHGVRIYDHRRRPTTLAAELLQLYPARAEMHARKRKSESPAPCDPPAWTWPIPAIYNEPLR